MSTGLAFVDGIVPASLDGAHIHRPLIEATHHAAILHVPPVGRYLVRPGKPIVIDRADGVGDADVRAFLDTTVLALDHLLGSRFALRAATVVIDGRAVAICGSSASGKSTAAAALSRRGHAVLADSVTVVDAGIAYAGPSALTLWPDALAWLDHAPDAGHAIRPSLPCRSIEPLATVEDAPLAAVIILGMGTPGRGTTVTEVRGGERIKALVGHEWHTPLLTPLGLTSRHFRWTIDLAALTMVRVRRDRAARDVDMVANAIEAVLR
ncbi:MAG: HPr kinase/phosphorylase [Acidimicrobiales bacterium]|nr:HPr kinase/phosphorylase [Acidimicrobiales bacterium]